jgi:sensor histidine kinase YesM
MENAIEHGKADDRPTTIALRVARSDGMLDISLSDDGPGMSQARANPERIGLSNTRERLHHLYGPDASVSLSAIGAAANGTVVRVRIPFHERAA